MMVGKAKRKALELCPHRKIVNGKPCQIPEEGGVGGGGTREISATIKGFRDGAGSGGDSYPMPTRLLSLTCAKDRWGLENDSGLF